MPKQKLRQFDFLTIFPDIITSYANESILGRAQKAGLIKVAAHNLRDFATDKHHRVDDTPYGGGAGMVMMVGVFDLALKGIGVRGKGRSVRIILTSASGKQFTQKDAVRLAKFDRIIFLCGRYEGVDARVEENLVDESFSVGPYVLTGGELPALTMMDAIARNVPGVLGSKESLAEESHTEEGQLEYPQYTKPEVYKKWKVPEVLLSGDHKKIAEWRKLNQKKS
ncbi:MAG: tRNA (guanine-N(1)-)-methyltransferase [Candidatus Uhrbacteria bacterium GW2011_GWE2_45_35]|uniref:tRNA (guanine-N(1)-)-methyltransferase n=2 Tax=Candidatus Uhriibacteriota TaxID=1752732 RepID=A0A0G1JDI3_9BACT|nr:MAG: tRNA (guanine-N(1)-)-methyltransferase [Candidatus Uhrbacteria bacterium GW2011_GWF2_44_350]KKU06497.1 MAG: tRNA (guanine-N(1)-)-methyltransferase [Candidatus Uhrbacteria bacterium GW2011_GWE2_45_35]HBR81065.1 tRNA (guanosine(37)-N1)-methyltransferase TrmD [Candidatus Uhrbacteria bacterium]